MVKANFCVILIAIFIAGCVGIEEAKKEDIIKITDFALSPDEEKIAFAAVTPVGNTDIWVIDIDGANLKKLTFKDRSPSNHIARFYKRRKWRNFFKIDMHTPEWTRDGRIAFSQELTKYHRWGIDTVSIRYWTIKSDGSEKKGMIDNDRIVTKGPSGPINRYKTYEEAKRHKKKIFLRDGTLWTLDQGEASPKKLIQ